MKRELQDKTIQMYCDGISAKEISEQYGISQSTIYQWLKKTETPLNRTSQGVIGILREKDKVYEKMQDIVQMSPKYRSAYIADSMTFPQKMAYALEIFQVQESICKENNKLEFDGSFKANVCDIAKWTGIPYTNVMYLMRKLQSYGKLTYAKDKASTEDWYIKLL